MRPTLGNLRVAARSRHGGALRTKIRLNSRQSVLWRRPYRRQAARAPGSAVDLSQDSAGRAAANLACSRTACQRCCSGYGPGFYTPVPSFLRQSIPSLRSATSARRSCRKSPRVQQVRKLARFCPLNFPRKKANRKRRRLLPLRFGSSALVKLRQPQDCG